MKHKGGYVYGSIYERNTKGEDTSYIAEVNFQGKRMRRSSKDKEILIKWMQSVCERVNGIVDEYNDNLNIEIMALKKRLYADMVSKVKPLLDAAKVYDLTNKVCADRVGLLPATTFQTYMVRDKRTGLVKIGKSKDIHTRLQVLGHHDRQLIGYLNKDIEVSLHAAYNDQII